MKKLVFLLLLCAAIVKAEDANIWLPNIPGYATGTASGGKNGLDVNINSGSIPVSFPSSLPVVITSPLPLPVLVGNSTPIAVSGTVSVENTVSVNVSNFPGSQSVTQGTSPWVVGQSSGANLHADIDNFPATQPVSGNISVSQSTSSNPWVDNVSQVGGSPISLGQSTMAGSIPVAIASDQSAITVSQATASNLNAAVVGIGTAGTPSGGVLSIQGVSGGFAIPISGTVSSTPSGTQNVNLFQVGGSGVVLGQTTAATSIPVVLSNDQSVLPVATSPSNILSTPTSNLMAALNATVQYSMDTGGNYYLTLTNAPGATTTWSGTVTFQYSTNGSVWNSLTAYPVASPANSASTTTATANGLWLVESPAGVGSDSVFIRANMTSYTSGQAYFFAASQASPNSRVILPWMYTITSGNTLIGPLEASGFSEVDVQISTLTTTVYTAQGTNDPTLSTWVTVPVISETTQAAAIQTLNSANTFRIMTNGFKWIRVQCTTTGTVGTIQGVVGVIGQQMVLTSYGNDIGVTVNSSALPTGGATAGNQATIYTNADQASAAITTTTTGATKTLAQGSAVAFNVNITAASGTSETYDFQVQSSVDGTVWNTIWQAPRQTGISSITSPFLNLIGLDYRYVETIGGSTPSFTRTITTNRAFIPGVGERNVIDRTINPITTGSTTASLYVDGTDNYSAIVNQGSGGSAVNFALDGSDDNSNWVQGLAYVTGVTGGATPVVMSYSGVHYRWIRARVVTGVGSTTISYVSLYGTQNPNAKPPVNSNGSVSSNSVTTSESSVAAPANAIGVIIEGESGNAGNIRWGISNSSSSILSSTVGVLTEPGRDSGFVPVGAGAYVHLISVAAGTNNADIQWVLSQ